MKKIYTLLVFAFLLFKSDLSAQPCNNYFELLTEPTITDTTTAGKILSAEIKISLINLSFIPELELHTMQNGIGLTDSVTSFTNHSGVSTEMVGGQVATDEFPLNPPANANGEQYTSWLVYGHTVEGTPASPPQIIPIGDTACIATITLNFNGTQEFTDDVNSATAQRPFLLDPQYISVLPGNSIANNPTVLNNFGTVAPNGFPIPLSCYNTVSDATVLAVQLFDFNGQVQNQGNILQWSVMNEVDVNYHELERRLDEETDFKPIFRINGKNEVEHLNTYQFLDEIKTDKAFYRIKSVENNEEISYSQILFLKRDLDHKISVFPNPTAQYINIQYDTKETRRVNFNIYNQLGKLHFSTEREVFEGNNAIRFDIENLPAGNYFLQIGDDEQIVNKEIIKLKN